MVSMNQQSYSVTSKGQVTLPKELRERIGLKPGGFARFELLDDHTIAIKTSLTPEELRQQVGPPAGNQPLTPSERRNAAARGLL